MQYNFDEVINRIGTNSVKWEAGAFLKKYGITDRFDADSIPLFVADMDFACPQPVLDALHQRVDQMMFGYTLHLTDKRYIEAIINWFSRRQNWQINAEEIVFCPGTVHALNISIKAYTKPGEKVIIQRPVYPPFTRTVETQGRVVVNNELVNNNGFYTIDFDDLAAKAKDPQTTMMFLCSPHNPVGRIWSREALGKMLEICNENDVVMISDEIHGDIIRENNTFYPMANEGPNDNLVVCTAINKTFNVAGLHCSNIIIKNKVLREKFQAELGMQFPSPFAISALIAAYNEGEEWLAQLNTYIDGNFDFLRQFLAEKMPEVKFWYPEGSYIGWLDFSAYGLSPDEIHDRIYNKANVVLEDGKLFGKGSEQFQRICIPTRRELLKEAMERIEREFRQ